MSDEMRVNRASMAHPESPMSHMGRSGGSSKMSWVVLVLVIIIVVILGVLFKDKLMGSPVKSSGYQAVFLTSGQVYFGKISHSHEQFETLTDIFYLQVTTTPALQGSQQTAAQQASQKLTLIKLGDELHGPVDSMQINRDQVLFFEDMKDDGKVMQAIHEYKKNPPAPVPATQAPAAQTPTTQIPAAPATMPIK